MAEAVAEAGKKPSSWRILGRALRNRKTGFMLLFGFASGLPFALFLGTLFAPIDDRDEPGRGFTHKAGDVVRIATPRLGALINRVTTAKAAAPWTFGVRELIANLSRRGLIGAAS